MFYATREMDVSELPSIDTPAFDRRKVSAGIANELRGFNPARFLRIVGEMRSSAHTVGPHLRKRFDPNPHASISGRAHRLLRGAMGGPRSILYRVGDLPSQLANGVFSSRDGRWLSRVMLSRCDFARTGSDFDRRARGRFWVLCGRFAAGGWEFRARGLRRPCTRGDRP